MTDSEKLKKANEKFEKQTKKKKATVKETEQESIPDQIDPKSFRKNMGCGG